MQKAVQQLVERGLAGAVLADNAHELARIDTHVEVVDRGTAMGIGKGHIGELDHRLLIGAAGDRRDMGRGLGRIGGRVLARCIRKQGRDELVRLGNIEAGCLAAWQQTGFRQTVRDARDAGAVDTHLAQLVCVGKDLVGLAVKREPSVCHDEHTAAVFRQQRNLLLDDDYGDAVLAVDLAQSVKHECGACRVERCRGLVEHEHIGRHGDNRGNRDLLLLSARKRSNLAVTQVTNADGRQRLTDAFFDLVVRHAEVLEAKEHLVFNDGRNHLGIDILQHASHHARDIREGDLAGVAPIDERGSKELAGVMVGDGSAHNGGKRRFAGARGTDDAHKLTLFDGERDVIEGILRLVDIGKRDVIEFDDGIAGAHGGLSIEKGRRPKNDRRSTW